MTTITMPKGKPDNGTVFFVYRAKVATGSSMHTSGVITEAQHKAIVLILQGNSSQHGCRTRRGITSGKGAGDAVYCRRQ